MPFQEVGNQEKRTRCQRQIKNNWHQKTKQLKLASNRGRTSLQKERTEHVEKVRLTVETRGSQKQEWDSALATRSSNTIKTKMNSPMNQRTNKLTFKEQTHRQSIQMNWQQNELPDHPTKKQERKERRRRGNALNGKPTTNRKNIHSRQTTVSKWTYQIETISQLEQSLQPNLI